MMLGQWRGHEWPMLAIVSRVPELIWELHECFHLIFSWLPYKGKVISDPLFKNSLFIYSYVHTLSGTSLPHQ
jgi:hypothetical protein